MTRSLLLAAAAGAAFGVASVLTKTATSEMLAGSLPLTSALAIAGLAAAGQVLSQRSYGPAGMAAPLAMASVANPAVAGAIGILLLGDTVRFGAAGALLALTAALVTMRGAIGLTAMSTTAPARPARPISDHRNPLSPVKAPATSATGAVNGVGSELFALQRDDLEITSIVCADESCDLCREGLLTSGRPGGHRELTTATAR